MKVNALEMFENNRKWLEYHGFAKALEDINAELYVVKLMVKNELDPHGDIINQGVCSLLNTIGTKLSDLAAGRTPDCILPTLSDN